MKRLPAFATTCFALLVSVAFSASAQQKKPNILVIFGDDIGYWNVSAYSQGMMGFKTPNIDRIAHEGALFTDYYAQQSCNAGRSDVVDNCSGLDYTGPADNAQHTTSLSPLDYAAETLPRR